MEEDAGTRRRGESENSPCPRVSASQRLVSFPAGKFHPAFWTEFGFTFDRNVTAGALLFLGYGCAAFGAKLCSSHGSAARATRSPHLGIGAHIGFGGVIGFLSFRIKLAACSIGFSVRLR